MDSSTAYELNASHFLGQRDKSLIGREAVSQWVKKLAKDTDVIDVACGSGRPITSVLLDAGLNVWAMDSSKSLIAEFNKRFPNVPTRCERVQESDFFNKQFDAVSAIGLVFLLSEFDQMSFIRKVSEIIKPGGSFLFTAPIEVGTWLDENTGINCLSLGYSNYKALLESSEFKLINTFHDEGKNNYYDVERLS